MDLASRRVPPVNATGEVLAQMLGRDPEGVTGTDGSCHAWGRYA